MSPIACYLFLTFKICTLQLMKQSLKPLTKRRWFHGTDVFWNILESRGFFETGIFYSDLGVVGTDYALTVCNKTINKSYPLSVQRTLAVIISIMTTNASTSNDRNMYFFERRLTAHAIMYTLHAPVNLSFSRNVVIIRIFSISQDHKWCMWAYYLETFFTIN